MIANCKWRGRQWLDMQKLVTSVASSTPLSTWESCSLYCWVTPKRSCFCIRDNAPFSPSRSLIQMTQTQTETLSSTLSWSRMSSKASWWRQWLASQRKTWSTGSYSWAFSTWIQARLLRNLSRIAMCLSRRLLSRPRPTRPLSFHLKSSIDHLRKIPPKFKRRKILKALIWV